MRIVDTHADYIVVHLEKGWHNISDLKGLDLSWSGPNQPKTKFKKI